MKALIINPGSNDVVFTYIKSMGNNQVTRNEAKLQNLFQERNAAFEEIFISLSGKNTRSTKRFPVDFIAIKVRYGGDIFRHSEVVDNDTIDKLNELVVQAPLHIPSVILLIELCKKYFPDAPIVLLFETAFFTKLPERERTYGIESSLSKEFGIKRNGFNGLFHQAACKYIWRLRRESGLKNTPRILSICMESKPELAAVMGMVPQMVTSGVTPLEGLPGKTTCGELDPTIILTLSHKFAWGPEQINQMLTKESGIYGLCGKPVNFIEIFSGDDPSFKLARELFKYRLLLFAGAGIAAMGGLDAIVFSGKYASVKNFIGEELRDSIAFTNEQRNNILLEIYDENIENIMVEESAKTAIVQIKERQKQFA